MAATNFIDGTTVIIAAFMNDVSSGIYSNLGDGTNYTGNLTIGSTKFVVTAASGNLAINTNKFTVAGASGNTLIAGTLALTGDATLSGNLSVPGGMTGCGANPSASTWLTTFGSSTTVSSLRIPPGIAPTSPVDGDIWTTTSGMFVQINGSTIGPLT